ncbi:MAG TPA: hypothetical protein VFM10_11435 [Terriglobales bacterium]|jgi:hypothetical protein|nr:hypothetical protein [Terriglobales bacterium]
MATTILTAPQYDPRREKRKKQIIAAIILVVLGIAALGYAFRNWPEERIVDKFFTALEHKDYKQAYGIWLHDPSWQQHPQNYPNYPFNEFYQDWGPGGEWGIIRSFHIDGSANPKHASGVVVVVTVNERVADKARIWVEKSDKTLTFSPY